MSTDGWLDDAMETDLDVLLDLVRLHFGMDVAFVARFEGGLRHFDHVSAHADAVAPAPGDTAPVENSLCARVVDGRLAAVTRDLRQDPRLLAVPGVAELRVGAYLGVPITLAAGEVYGTLCCYRHDAAPELDERDRETLGFVAGIIAARAARATGRDRENADVRAEIRHVLEAGGPDIWLQPIVELGTGEHVGFEALARFSGTRAVDDWFRVAWDVGLGSALEFAAAANALDRLGEIPAGTYLAVNLSPGAILVEDVERLFEGRDLQKIVIEMTEQQLDAADDDGRIEERIADGRRCGMRLAIDDVGRGFSDIARMLDLAPDILKIDRSVVVGVDEDPTRQVMLAGLVAVSRLTGATLLAEGIETASERDALVKIGISVGQGYLLGRPARELSTGPSLTPVQA